MAKKAVKEDASHRFAKDQLKAFVERIERLEEEKKALADDIREVYAEAKGNGYDVTALREIIKLRKQDKDERAEHEAVLDTYKNALGMLFDLPLGQAATERATGAAKPVSDNVARAVASPGVRAAFKRLGTPVELTEEEKAKGYSVALIGKDGTRMAIGSGPGIGKPRQIDLEEAIAERGTG